MQTEDLKVVLKVAEFRNITAAAASLDLRTATASAALKRVEKALGVELFVRTTRQLRLSSAGEKYLPQCQQALQMLEQARLNIRDDRDQLEGELRIALSSDLGRNRVIPWLDEFMAEHPELTLRVNISDSNIDFYRDSVDVALRYGSPEDANLYGFRISPVPGILAASPGYLERHGYPSHPDELAGHNGLFYQLYDRLHDTWTFHRDGTEYKVKMQGNRASNDGDLVRRWCLVGHGLAAKSCLDLNSELLSGELVSVMPEYRPRASELWLVCPSRQSITPAVRLLRDRLKERCRAILQRLLERGIVQPDQLD